MNEIDAIKQAGVVGAGGAGFPTYVKMQSTVKTFILNAAECEPLLHKDKEILRHFARDVISGMKIAMNLTGAEIGFVAVKKKYPDVIAAIDKELDTDKIKIFPLGDFYPAGDEFELVYEITGKAIPSGGIPLDVGCVVNNVETIYNLNNAISGIPVTEKFITVAGAVENPYTARVKIGSPFLPLIEMAKPVTKYYRVIEGGPMTGTVVDHENAFVTKTTSGIIILPEDHYLIKRKTIPSKSILKITQYCTQCTRCTDLCPRHLLGHTIRPHRVMRNIGYKLTDTDVVMDVFNCCQCGLCEYFSCPVMLSPMSTIMEMKQFLISQGVKPEKGKNPEPDIEKKSRRVPVKRLVQRIDIIKYLTDAPLTEIKTEPREFTLLLKQHIGTPASPIKKPGEPVKKGEKVADIEDGKPGTPVHSPVDGKIVAITGEYIRIRKA